MSGDTRCSGSWYKNTATKDRTLRDHRQPPPTLTRPTQAPCLLLRLAFLCSCLLLVRPQLPLCLVRGVIIKGELRESGNVLRCHKCEVGEIVLRDKKDERWDQRDRME